MTPIRTLSFCLALCSFAVPTFAQDAIDTTRDDFYTGTVLSIVGERTETGPDVTSTVQTLRVRVNGVRPSEEVTVENNILGTRPALKLREGDHVVLERLQKSDGSVDYLLKEQYRLPRIVWLIGIFVLAAVALGGWTGFSSIAGLFVSIGILSAFVIPRIIAGDEPLLTCFLGAIAIACTSLYLAHGFYRRTSVALLSTLLTLCASALTSVVFVRAGKLFGMGSEESLYLQMGQLQNIDLRGLLLGGIVIGCLGVLDDITTAQTAAVDEIRKANPSMSAHDLRKAGLSVGKEHIASLINTLALAYIGTSLPLLLLLQSPSNQSFPLWVTLNGEFLAEEIVRTLVGSMTLLFAVPISTWLATLLLTEGSRAPSHGHHHRH